MHTNRILEIAARGSDIYGPTAEEIRILEESGRAPL